MISLKRSKLRELDQTEQKYKLNQNTNQTENTYRTKTDLDQTNYGLLQLEKN